MKVAFDTNILVYAADRIAGDKHRFALDLMERAAHADCALILQSLSEFFNASTKKLGLPPGDVAVFVNDWCSVFPVFAADESTLHHAIQTVRQHSFSFWDAMLCAAADQAGCRLLLSEDLQDGRRIDRLRIVNPFLESNAALLRSALPPVP